MRFSESWLREWVNPAVDTETLSHQLSMAGLEVDSVSPAAPDFNGVVVGLVTALEQHPDADKLRVAQVDVNGDESLQIVCGAKNVAEGMRVPVAIVGAVLPGDFKIKKAKLRGVQSLGMICSASELGLADSSDGIMPLPADAPLGTDFREYLNLDDTCIEVDLTPDRADCFGLIGVARDVSAIHRCEFIDAAGDHVTEAQVDDVIPVELHAEEACPRYLGRVIKGIDATAETPLWMQERLRRGEIRSLGPVIDVTNYVLLELGQPMHGFDLDKLSGGIHVRMAEQGEELVLLDGDTVQLRDDTLVIADDKQALAMAGIMGGESSAVTDTTSNILLEAAFFNPLAISGKSRSYGKHTDSSHRFERGVDPQLQRRAIERATELLLEICGGQPGPVIEEMAAGFDKSPAAIQLRSSRVERLLGVSVDAESIEQILTHLGMQLEANGEGWMVMPPSWRFDISIEADLIEEIGRIYGYDNIPSRRGQMSAAMALEPEANYALDEAKSLLVARDYQEVISYSFIDKGKASKLDPEGERILLANPISADMSTMRPTLWGGLLTAAAYNKARQQERIRIFETGLRFLKQDNEIKQEKCLSGLVNGAVSDEQWGDASRVADFYDIKADVEALLDVAGAGEEFSFVAGSHPALHPGQTARIEKNGELVGWVGLLHPQLEKTFDMSGKTWLFELNLEVLQQGSIPAFEPLTKFPSIRRDFAIVVNADVSWADIQAEIRKSSPEIVREILLFDVYTGENVESGTKSLALALILQDYSKTLTLEEVQSATEQVLEALESRFAAKLRD
ncbi:phenylalanine--tRNA ligase subunit beta [Solemya velum gill symbiont]|uniref:phenylalanine--tRNA ligase subunit beta n=1 Tax=Solemya velum gill symbiont TaxID=2340 RepID=UPI0009987DA8|nr:phenylalanine--tRNA ligase subunit beta [Solemya velum gill symbiont]OOZ44611.1 phenylalanine--tRNA ligase subunit beta [Solemya velum gill symbiont]OOZ46795.1 phenylalanine--tRNA ligase subunit beta [Solemya velum gill symbiont]OOZ49250.1 phenylalanine--tRNA ligase subunit beta [Solemya velum gill symbiont]OOZ51604.1 phenylalanine--tRNA ligase subunit beta [Solemya velum gill symbiont]OOZ54258.1 phenylalanine--tRNA ligase subunit beta [Solemya velum gill symbiont]